MVKLLLEVVCLAVLVFGVALVSVAAACVVAGLVGIVAIEVRG